MKFIIARNALQKELAFVQGVVERKNTIPVLANILIESTSDETLRISGTDLDVTIRCEVIAESIAQKGAICVQARKLFDIARLLPNAPVSFRKEQNDWVTVECGQAKFKLPGISKETFPDLPAFKATPFSIAAASLKRIIEQTIFSITSEEGRYVLAGAKFELNANGAKVVTTDGHRLSLISAKDALTQTGSESLDALIPRKTLAELSKLATGFEGQISMGADDNHVYFQIGTRLLISRLLSGQFPNYEMVLPKENDRTAIFNTSELNNALKRVSLMADERSHAITLLLGNEEALIASQNPEDGEAKENVTTDYAGEETKIGFNAQYLQEFLNVVGTETVSFLFKDGNSQAEFRPVSATEAISLRYICMPMRCD